MRAKTRVLLILVASLSMFAGARAVPAQNPPPPPVPAQGQREQGPIGPVTIGAGMMTPEMMQVMGPMVRAQNAGGHGRESAGPLQTVSRLMTALDDSRVRTMLGLSDEQANRLRKIVIDTEIFTIQTGANIAVDSIELRELLRADKPDKTAVMTKGDEISKDTSELISHYLDAILTAKTILTPEQQKMIRAYLESGAPALPAAPARP
jgi:Spy/CpxP family protein refolding chaperone